MNPSLPGLPAGVRDVVQASLSTLRVGSGTPTCSLDLPLDLIGRGFVGNEEARWLPPGATPAGLAPRTDHPYSAGGDLLRRFGDGLCLGATLAWAGRVRTNPNGSHEGLWYGLRAEVVP